MKHKFTRIYKLKAELKLKTKDSRRKDFLRTLGKRDSNVYQVTQVTVVCFLYHSAVTEISIYLRCIFKEKFITKNSWELNRSTPKSLFLTKK